MPHSLETIDADVTIAAHAICVRTTMLSLHLNENFLRFQVQDKHNASYFSLMYWKSKSLTIRKNTKKLVKTSFLQCQ